MHRRFRFCAGIALMSLASGPILFAQEGEATALPTPRKHQLRATPAQIVEHLLSQQRELIVEQGKQIALQTKVLEELGKKIQEQGQLFAALQEQNEEMHTQLATLQGQFIQVSEKMDAAAARAQEQQVVITTPDTANPVSSIPSVTTSPPPPASVAGSDEPFPATSSAPSADETNGEEEQTVPGGKVHIVQRGETLTHIARTYNTSVEELMKLNQIKDARKLQAGHSVFIPQ